MLFAESFINYLPFYVNNLFIFAGRGIYILYEDVKSCPYEDVQILWSMLVESHSPSLSSREL
jgi:hypothetical protein